MESFDYTESALIFGLQTRDDFKKFNFPLSAWAKHGPAYTFILKHFDEYGNTPSEEVLLENFPTLDISARSAELEYAIDVFRDQVTQRAIIAAFQDHKELTLTEPRKAVVEISTLLNALAVNYDDDVSSYTDGGEDRLLAWKKRAEIRERADGMLGIPTTFESFNKTGVGWLNGEMIAVFARPTIGKTWICIANAVDAMLAGYRTLLISTEMPKDQIEMRVDVVAADRLGYELSHTALKTGDDIDVQEYMKLVADMESRSMLICDHIGGEGSISMSGIEGLIRKHKPDFLVVDGIYLVSSGQGKKAMWEQSHALFYGMKNLAMAHNIPILVSTQATKEASNTYEPPQAHEVAFGDALIRAADVAFSMYGIENSDHQRAIQMQKFRDGEQPFDTATLQWDVDKGRIAEYKEVWD